MNFIDALYYPVFVLIDIRINTFESKLVLIKTKTVLILYKYHTSTYRVAVHVRIDQQTMKFHALPCDHYYRRRSVLLNHLDMCPFGIQSLLHFRAITLCMAQTQTGVMYKTAINLSWFPSSYPKHLWTLKSISIPTSEYHNWHVSVDTGGKWATSRPSDSAWKFSVRQASIF